MLGGKLDPSFQSIFALSVETMAVSNGFKNGTTNGETSNGHSNNTGQSSSLPLIISGGGCVGLFLALLISSFPSSPRIIIIEPAFPDPTSTRAMAHQPPTYPILSRVPGLLPKLIAAGSLSSGLCFRTSVASGSKVIAEKKFDNAGEGLKGKGQLLLPQGKFQEVMLRMLEGRDVEIKRGWGVKKVITSGNESVTIEIEDGKGRTKVLEGSYLVAADGAKSVIRKGLGKFTPFDIMLEGNNGRREKEQL